MTLHAAPPQPRLALVRAALILSVALLAAILATWVLRSGLADPGYFLFAVAVFGLGSIWIPIHWLAADQGESAPSPGSAALMMVLGPVLPLLGFAFGTAATWGLASLVVLVWSRHRKLLRQAAAAGTPAIIGGGLLLAVVVVMSGAAWRLFIPESIALGVAPADNYFHVAIAQISARHLIPSTGGDGLALQHYHFGSHLVAAGLARAASSTAGLVYVYWALILLKLQLAWALVAGNLLLARRDTAAPVMFPLLAYASLLVLLGPLESESFMLAMAVFAAAAPLMCRLFADQAQPPASAWPGLLILLAAAFICATAKVSVGYFCAAALAWLMWRRRASPGTVLLLLAGLAALGAYTVLFVLPFEQSLAQSGIGVLLGSYAQYASQITLVSYALPCLVVWGRLRQLRLSTSATSEAGRSGVALDLHFLRGDGWRGLYGQVLRSDGLTQLHALCLAACCLVLVGMPIGGGMAYFSYLLLLLPALVSPTWLYAGQGVTLRRWTRLIAAACAIHLAVGFTFSYANLTSLLARAAQSQTAAAYRDANDGPGLGKRAIATSLSRAGNLFGSLRVRIDHTPWAELLRQIGSRDDAGLQVFAPPAAEEFWTRLRAGQNNPYWCMQAHLMIPAALGIPMIAGIGPAKFESGCSPIAGIYGFGREQDRHRTRELSDAQLCEIARARRIGAVYVLDSISSPATNRTLRCPASP